ncbi:hypothetical protein, partial [Niallia circulans]|uniref:hypothetical protein n=1 Tax=Niallia circulans TaxID=1397 RepID=UPI00397B6CC7
KGRDKLRVFLGLLIAIIFILLGIAVVAAIKENNECNAKGGKMVGTGEYSTTFVLSGKVMVPVTNENLECSRRKEG